ncbi:MAG: RtcB family protein [Treponema sp.]|nr:RtcB family protein [Treponema sp.]
MPDVHAGAGCTIGTTMTIGDKIVPNLVGVDIGCGMETIVIKADSNEAKDFNPVQIDEIIHNYIDTDSMVLRKGAVSAKLGEKHIIPINMRDGSLICEGLGNQDWNYSSPHGAGRLMSRAKAVKTIKMEDYEKSMEGIYSTSVNKETLDESPFAYKNMDNIIKNIGPTAKLLKIIKPIYNYKAAEEKKW